MHVEQVAMVIIQLRTFICLLPAQVSLARPAARSISKNSGRFICRMLRVRTKEVL